MIKLTTCPYAGIICVECQHPIGDDVREIGRHEIRAHSVRSNIYERVAFVKQFDNEMKDMARGIKDILRVDPEQAKKTYLEYVGVQENYPFCTHSDCNKLVHSNNHKSRMHKSLCTATMLNGVASAKWKMNTPTIIPLNEFDFRNPDYFNPVFYGHLIDESNITTKCSCGSSSFNGTICLLCHIDSNDFGSSEKAHGLRDILANQMLLVDSSKSSSMVNEIDQKLSPNMWIRSNGWDKILEGIQYQTIYEYVSSEPSEAEQTFLDGIKVCLWDVMKLVSDIEPSHQIMSEVQRRTKFHDIDSRFPFHVWKQKTTWDKYFCLVSKIVLVFIRMMEDIDRNDIGIPNVTFTEHQKVCYGTIKNTTLEDGPQRSRLYMDFLLSMVDVTIHKSMKDIAFLVVVAMISVKKDFVFASAVDTTPKLAAILAVYKLLFLGKCINCFSGSTDQSWVIQIQEFVGKHFILYDEGKVHTPLSSLVKVFMLGIKIAREATSVGTVWWEGETVHHQTIMLSATQFRTAIMMNIEWAKKKLLKLLDMENGTNLPSIPWASIVDNQADETPDYSFVTELQNSSWLKLDNYRTQLCNRLSTKFVDTNQQLQTSNLHRYEMDLAQFLKALLTLFHVTGGQPARGTEICNMAYMNTMYSQRNIFIYRGFVCFSASYHKGMMHTAQFKRIFRFVPREVGELVVYYLWLVLPFWRTIKGAHLQLTVNSPFIWTKKVVIASFKDVSVWSTETLSIGLRLFFQNRDITVRTYRHLIIAIGRKYLNVEWGSDDDNDDGSEVFGDNCDDVALCNDLLDLQATHTTNTAIRTYARGASENRSSHQSLIDNYLEISIQHHDFIYGRASTSASTVARLQAIHEMQKYGKYLQQERLCSLTGDTFEMSLQFFFKSKDATFRGNQLAVLTAIGEREHTSILQICGTGVGKSLSFMLPSFICNGGTTIVVVPLVSLQKNFLSRCMECGISANIWNSDYMQDMVHKPNKLLFVSPESVMTKGFQEYVTILQSNARLDRIVLDECHMYLDSSKHFRSNMLDVCQLIKMTGVQLLLLTATLPIGTERELFEKLQLQPHAVKVFRDRTIRTNIHYEVRDIGSLSLCSQVQSVLAEVGFQNERIIVYVQSIRDGLDICQHLDLPFFHAHAVDKFHILDNWMAAHMNRVIVATSALGCGIDIPDIRLVLHAGAPRSMIEFAQQSGRAGRDGNRSVSIVLHCTKQNEKNSTEMKQFLKDGCCRRTVLDHAMDDIKRQGGCLLSENPCDYCQDQKQAGVNDENDNSNCNGVNVYDYDIYNCDADNTNTTLTLTFGSQTMSCCSSYQLTVVKIKGSVVIDIY